MTDPAPTTRNAGSPPGPHAGAFPIVHLGRLAYAPAFEAQQHHHAAVLSQRETEAPELGRILTVEHDPVVTVSRRPTAAQNLLATPEMLAASGVEVRETDRGGDITYHGPGQVVLYPIIDLKRTRLRIIEYIRLLEQAVIDTIADWGIEGARDDDATGVWVERDGRTAKVCAIGVRVRKWVTLHGLAVNVRTDLDYFNLIVPCGLAGRPVTRLADLLEGRCPTNEQVRDAVAHRVARLLAEHAGVRL